MIKFVAEEIRSIVDLGVQIGITVWIEHRPITWGCWPPSSTAWHCRMH
jgi:hypothetical protein